MQEKKIETFYRLTAQEKERLIEKCRKEIEEKKIREIETVRQILEQLLEEKWEAKKKTAQKNMREMLDDLQQKLTAAEARERQGSTAASGMSEKLTAAEKRSSELSADLTLTSDKLVNCQERLRTSEARVLGLTDKLTREEHCSNELRGKLAGAEQLIADLQKKLGESEEASGSLQAQVNAAGDTNDTLRMLYTASEKTVENLRRAQSESARTIEELEEALRAKERDAETDADDVKKYRREAAVLEKKLEQAQKEHAVQKKSARCGGLFGGILLAAALSVVIFPTQYVDGSPVPAEQNSGVSGTYTGGGNMFDCFSGFGELRFDDRTVCRGFWANGALLHAAEYVFPDGGVYSGAMWFNNRPLGAGFYTRLDGEKIFGLWSWAEYKTVKVGASDVEYIYTGPLRFGEPYGYGVFVGTAEENRFVGEFYDDIFQNGTWIDPDGKTGTINNQ